MHRVPCHVRIFKVDLRHGHQAEILLVLVRGPDHARDRGAGPESELPDHVRTDVDVVRSGQVIGLGRSHETETVLHDLENAFAENVPSLFGTRLQNAEHHIALAHDGRIGDFEFFGHCQQFGRAFSLQVRQ